MDVYYASCCCSFLCSFHYVSSFYYHGCDYDYYFSSGDCCVLWYVTSLNGLPWSPSLIGLPATSGQHDVIVLPPLTPRHSGNVVGLATVQQQQPTSQMPLQAYANYVIGPPQVGFSFRVASYHFVFLCLVSVLDIRIGYILG